MEAAKAVTVGEDLSVKGALEVTGASILQDVQVNGVLSLGPNARITLGNRAVADVTLVCAFFCRGDADFFIDRLFIDSLINDRSKVQSKKLPKKPPNKQKPWAWLPRFLLLPLPKKQSIHTPSEYYSDQRIKLFAESFR